LANSGRDVTPHDVALVTPALASFVDHPLLLGRDEIQQGIADNAHQPVRGQQRSDLLARTPAEEGQLVADRRVLRAGASAARWRWSGARIELPVDDYQPPARPEHACPLVDRGLGMSQRPEHMAADYEVEGRRREREVLGVAFLEPDRDRPRHRLAPRF